jgi:5-methylcytosine-specific restriction protein A
LPLGKKISQQGFNYLNSDNVSNLINIALQRNLTNKKLKRFVDNFPLTIKLAKEKNDLHDFIEVIGNSSADDIAGINELEKKMKKQLPEIKQRISTFIERGSIANKIKKMTGYKCLICEAMGMHHHTFIKPNGEHYIETHHVEPVSSMKVGVLGIGNLLTLCANHHRQLHYGNSILLEQTAKYFTFKIDEKTIQINKISIVKI